MKRRLLLLLLIMNFISFVTFQSLTAQTTGNDTLVGTPSIKVIHHNGLDPLQMLLEEALLQKGWIVISHNQITYPICTGASVNVQTADTVYTIPQTGMFIRELFAPKASDYILRYFYFNYSNGYFRDFKASLIHTGTGQVIATFDAGPTKQNVKQVLGEMSEVISSYTNRGVR